MLSVWAAPPPTSVMRSLCGGGERTQKGVHCISSFPASLPYNGKRGFQLEPTTLATRAHDSRGRMGPPNPAAWEIRLLKEILVSWFAPGRRMLEIEIAPVEEGVKSGGERERKGDTQREKPRERRRTRHGHPKGRLQVGAHLFGASASPAEESPAHRTQHGAQAPSLPSHAQPPT